MNLDDLLEDMQDLMFARWVGFIPWMGSYMTWMNQVSTASPSGRAFEELTRYCRSKSESGERISRSFTASRAQRLSLSGGHCSSGQSAIIPGAYILRKKWWRSWIAWKTWPIV